MKGNERKGNEREEIGYVWKDYTDRVGEGGSETSGKLLSGGHLEEGGTSPLPSHLEQHLSIFVSLLLSSQLHIPLQAFLQPPDGTVGKNKIREEMGNFVISGNLRDEHVIRNLQENALNFATLIQFWVSKFKDFS